MAFKIRDLMIQVVSGQDGGGDPECSCGPASMRDDDPGMAARPEPCTCGPASRIEPMAATPCSCGPETMWPRPAKDYEPRCTCGVATMGFEDPAPGLTTITTVTTVTTVTTLVQGGGRPKDLKALKEELRRLLEELERRERSHAQEPAGLPKTVEEADDLERRLQGAIKELRDHKETLKKPDAPAPGQQKGRKGRK
ncbi:MAG TPA: hypothetical protein VN493_10455 [Thermoanaerobaculia bacterium]|nr:hypothetical protein [Thermoanaerobaculia bacterium]